MASDAQGLGRRFLKATSLEKPAIAENAFIYFLFYVPALEAVGAERVGTVYTKQETVDEYVGPDGERVYIGYDAGGRLRPGDRLYSAALKVLEMKRASAESEDRAMVALIEGCLETSLPKPHQNEGWMRRLVAIIKNCRGGK